MVFGATYLENGGRFWCAHTGFMTVHGCEMLHAHMHASMIQVFVLCEYAGVTRSMRRYIIHACRFWYAELAV